MPKTIDQISRVINMFSKKELDLVKDKLALSTAQISNIVSEIKKDTNKNYKDTLLADYKFVFKPYSSCILQYTELTDEENHLSETKIGEWQVIKKEKIDKKIYFLIERNGNVKKINTGWEYTNVDVKEVGIVAVYEDLKIMEIRSNMVTQKRIQKVFSNYFKNLNPINVNRSYYVAILEELKAKEFSVLWETEGDQVSIARLDGNNVSVKNGAVITIPGVDSEEEKTINLLTDANPKTVGSMLEDLNTKIYISSNGHLKFSKLMKEKEVNDIVYKIVSAVYTLPVSKNQLFNQEKTEVFIPLFVEFCKETDVSILNRFSRRYFSFRNSLSTSDADFVLKYLVAEGVIEVIYELYNGENELISIVTEYEMDNPELLPDEYYETIEKCYDSASSMPEIKKFYKVKQSYKATLDIFQIQETKETSLEVSKSPIVGMNDSKFVDEIISKEVHDEYYWKQQKRLLSRSIDNGNQSKKEDLIRNFKRHGKQELLKEFALIY